MNAFMVFVLALAYSADVSGLDTSTEVPPVPTTEVTIGPGTDVPTTIKPVDPNDQPPLVNLILSHNQVCLMVQMRAQFNFTYNQSQHGVNETTYKTAVIYWDVPSNATVTGESSCNATGDGKHQLLVAEFFEGWRLKMRFSKDQDNKMTVDNITLNYIESSARFPNIVTPDANVSSTGQSKDFSWSEDGFKCTSDEIFNEFHKGNITQVVYMETSDVKIEAFINKKDAVFGKNFAYCAKDTKVSNIVPIAVGAALAGLVLIVLVAYLIGRSRNKRGYESV